jgi:hypothetical protein
MRSSAPPAGKGIGVAVAAGVTVGTAMVAVTLVAAVGVAGTLVAVGAAGVAEAVGDAVAVDGTVTRADGVLVGSAPAMVVDVALTSASSLPPDGPEQAPRTVSASAQLSAVIARGDSRPLVGIALHFRYTQLSVD